MGNGVSKDELEKKHVVIIGGGYGGMEAAAECLSLGIPFTLIDPKVTSWHLLRPSSINKTEQRLSRKGCAKIENCMFN